MKLDGVEERRETNVILPRGLLSMAPLTIHNGRSDREDG